MSPSISASIKREQVKQANKPAGPGDVIFTDELDYIQHKADRDPILGRFDLLCPTALFELAQAMQMGAKRYGVNNFQE